MTSPAIIEPDFFKIPAKLTYAEWESRLHTTVALKEVLPFKIGDLMIFGEGKWGEECFQAVEGYNFHTIQNWVSISRAFPANSGTRSSGIAYGVYVILAGVKDEKKRYALAKQAVKEGWTIKKAKEMSGAFKADKKPKAIDITPSKEDDESDEMAGDIILHIKKKDWDEAVVSATQILEKYTEKQKEPDKWAIRLADFFGLAI